MNRIIRTSALALVAALALATPARAADKDIVDTAVAAGGFNTLAAALKAAGLVETLKGKGPFTPSLRPPMTRLQSCQPEPSKTC